MNWVRGVAWDERPPKRQTSYWYCLSLPPESSSDIRDKVFEQLTITDLKAKNGFKTLLAFLDRELQKYYICANCDKFNEFEEFL